MVLLKKYLDYLERENYLQLMQRLFNLNKVLNVKNRAELENEF